MSIYLRVDDAAGLRAVEDLVHDAYFELDGVKVDLPSGTVVIPFRRLKTDGPNWWKLFLSTAKSAPAVNGVLTVLNVVSCTIDDTERIGSYDFDKLVYEEPTRQLVVRTNVPLKFELRVHALQVAVEVDGSLTGD